MVTSALTHTPCVVDWLIQLLMKKNAVRLVLLEVYLFLFFAQCIPTQANPRLVVEILYLRINGIVVGLLLLGVNCAKRVSFKFQLLEKEVYVWAKLRHNNILPLLGYAFDPSTGYPLLISRWMDNGSAWDYIQSHPTIELVSFVGCFLVITHNTRSNLLLRFLVSSRGCHIFMTKG